MRAFAAAVLTVLVASALACGSETFSGAESDASASDASASDGAASGEAGDARDTGVADGGAAADADRCPPPGDAAACPEGGVTWRGHCYFSPPGGSDYKPLAAANDLCAPLGAYLVTVTCAEEALHVNQLDPNSDTALGAESFDDGGTWKWLTGEPFAFTDWAAGEPANGWNCLTRNKSLKWESAPCGSTRYIICETGPLAQ